MAEEIKKCPIEIGEIEVGLPVIDDVGFVKWICGGQDGEVGIRHLLFNKSDKNIKKIFFSYIPFDSSGNVLADDITTESVVERCYDDSFYSLMPDESVMIEWKFAWKNPKITKAMIKECIIEYDDGTLEEIKGSQIDGLKDYYERRNSRLYYCQSKGFGKISEEKTGSPYEEEWLSHVRWNDNEEWLSDVRCNDNKDQERYVRCGIATREFKEKRPDYSLEVGNIEVFPSSEKDGMSDIKHFVYNAGEKTICKITLMYRVCGIESELKSWNEDKGDYDRYFLQDVGSVRCMDLFTNSTNFLREKEGCYIEPGKKSEIMHKRLFCCEGAWRVDVICAKVEFEDESEEIIGYPKMFYDTDSVYYSKIGKKEVEEVLLIRKERIEEWRKKESELEERAEKIQAEEKAKEKAKEDRERIYEPAAQAYNPLKVLFLLMKKDKDEFAKFHINQGLCLFIMEAIEVILVLFVSAVRGIMIGLFIITLVISFVLYLRTCAGKMTKLPIISKIKFIK